MFAKIEKFKTFSEVKFYTVRLERKDGEWENETETDKFFKEFLDQPEKPSHGAELVYNSIVEIGKRGAKERYFRFENRANAPPPSANTLAELGQSKETRGDILRLYCIRLSENVVILTNGDRKSMDAAQDCPNVAPHFRLANNLAKKIGEAIVNKEIVVNGKSLQFDDDFGIEL